VSLSCQVGSDSKKNAGDKAVRALQKLQARVEVGISYQDYTSALEDTKSEVNLFLQSPEAKKRLELTMTIEKAMRHYQAVTDVWKWKVDRHDSTIPADYWLWEFLLKTYPNLKEENSRWWDKLKERDPAFSNSRFYKPNEIFPDLAMQIILKEASKELGEATKLLSQ
jgi:hypothetical protein